MGVLKQQVKPLLQLLDTVRYLCFLEDDLHIRMQAMGYLE